MHQDHSPPARSKAAADKHAENSDPPSPRTFATYPELVKGEDLEARRARILTEVNAKATWWSVVTELGGEP